MTPRKRRKKTSSAGSGFAWLAAGLLAGIAGGYIWRSYAPIPLPFDSPLASEEALLLAIQDRAKDAEEEAARLRGAVRRLEREKAEIEEKLADLMIREALGGGPGGQ